MLQKIVSTDEWRDIACVRVTVLRRHTRALDVNIEVGRPTSSGAAASVVTGTLVALFRPHPYILDLMAFKFTVGIEHFSWTPSLHLNRRWAARGKMPYCSLVLLRALHGRTLPCSEWTHQECTCPWRCPSFTFQQVRIERAVVDIGTRWRCCLCAEPTAPPDGTERNTPVLNGHIDCRHRDRRSKPSRRRLRSRWATQAVWSARHNRWRTDWQCSTICVSAWGCSPRPFLSLLLYLLLPYLRLITQLFLFEFVQCHAGRIPSVEMRSRTSVRRLMSESLRSPGQCHAHHWWWG